MCVMVDEEMLLKVSGLFATGVVFAVSFLIAEHQDLWIVSALSVLVRTLYKSQLFNCQPGLGMLWYCLSTTFMCLQSVEGLINFLCA